jgi:hypothetical protein
MIPEIAKADSAYRRRLFTVYALILVTVYFGVPIVWRYFINYLMMANGTDTLRAAESAGIGFMLFFIGPALYLIAVGRRAASEERWPHTGMKVIYDTVIQQGPEAVARGRRLIWLGVVCIFIVLGGSAVTHFIFYKFKTDPFSFLPEHQRVPMDVNIPAAPRGLDI